MNIAKRLETFVTKAFKTTLDVFLDALKLSPNAQGYVSGSITELLLKRYLTTLGFVVERIREKWEGRKHPNHHGDFYLKDKHGKLKIFLFAHKDKINWVNLKTKQNTPCYYIQVVRLLCESN